jgi:phosphatidate cytidylyltransferase
VDRFYQQFGYGADIFLFLIMFDKQRFSMRVSFSSFLLISSCVFIFLFFCLSWILRLSKKLNFLSPFWISIGFLWISLPLSLAFYLRMMNHGFWWLFIAILAAAFYDTAAYFVGKGIGKHQAFPKISPGKTVEGTIGGILISGIAIFLMGKFLDMTLVQRILLGSGLPFAAVGGDLIESFFKRKAGLKDSGAILPGHGGVLDRIDSHLLTIFVLFFYRILLR